MKKYITIAVCMHTYLFFQQDVTPVLDNNPLAQWGATADWRWSIEEVYLFLHGGDHTVVKHYEILRSIGSTYEKFHTSDDT